jgi:hypothetical protein
MTMHQIREDSPHTYYARPVTAMQLNTGNLTEAAQWCGGRVQADDQPNGGFFVLVPHLDGNFHARPPHWLVRTGAGEFKMLDHQDFLDTYQINPPRVVAESAVPR